MIPQDKIRIAVDSLKGKKLFVTGGTGFFGKSFLDFLDSQSIFPSTKITILTRNPEQFLESHPKYKKASTLTFLKGDVESFDFPEETFDVILHFATPADAKLNVEDPLRMANIIIKGTQRVLDFAVRSRSQKFLFTSSGAVYGKQPTELLCTPETYSGAPDPTQLGSAYGEAKRMAELMGCEHSRRHGFEFKIARCFAFVGPHLDKNGTFAIGNFMRDALSGKNLQIKGDGTPFRSYLYSDDLIVWLLNILENGKNREAYNVGSDHGLNIKEIAEHVAKVLNPELQIIIEKQKPNQNPERYVPNIDKAKSQLGLDVWTNLESAISKSTKLI